MVCKENVVSWFGNLSSYKRIDVMCTLLNMCLPFEIRYIGTCVEDQGKRDYNDLRDTEHHANSVMDLTELTSESVTEKRTRRKLVLYMALLHSCNYACAVVLYKNLANLDVQEVINLLNGTSSNQEDQALEELLLLYAMALNHPAFTYDQKNTFGNIFVKLQEEEARLNTAKSSTLTSNKSTQSCLPFVSNDRIVDVELGSNCIAPSTMPTYPGEMRGNAIYTSIPPGLSIPPPGLCLPSPEQMSMGTGINTQYVHVGFPTMNHMQPWTGQVLMGNQLMYHTGEMVAYPPSPLVSRQSSPSQSRSPSRNNSPSRKNSSTARTSSQVTQTVSNALTSTSSSSNQTNTASASSSASFLPPHSVASMNRSLPSQQPPLHHSRSNNPPPIVGTTSYTHNNAEMSAATHGSSMPKQPPPPPRLRSTACCDSLRETLGKEMPNYKGNLQNLTLDEIRRMSDEDLRDIGLTSNAVGQLRNIVKSQTLNGLSQMTCDKKGECLNNSSNIGDQTDNEMSSGLENSDVNMNAKSMSAQDHSPVPQHQGHYSVPNMRRYPNIPPMDPSNMQMYATPPMYATQTPPCYACLAVPLAGVQNRYSRCNAQHVYCLGQLQALRLDPENNRHCSQSSSSESTGSRSPPETPPAAPWVGGAEVSSSVPPAADHLGSAPLHSVTSPLLPHPQPMPPPPERHRNRKSQSHVMRHKNHMVNGAGLPNVQHCMSFPMPPPHSQIAYLPHGHYPAMRPNTGVYSNFSPAVFARPAFPPAYQPNGEMMYPYHGLPGSGGTPPPPPPPQNSMPPAQPYMPPPPVVTYTPAVPPAKISCYNCGSNSHLATDCKDLTMEDLTKRAQYRIDYSNTKQPRECSSSEK